MKKVLLPRDQISNDFENILTVTARKNSSYTCCLLHVTDIFLVKVCHKNSKKLRHIKFVLKLSRSSLIWVCTFWSHLCLNT